MTIEPCNGENCDANECLHEIRSMMKATSEDVRNEIRHLLAVATAARALYGDLCAHDEEPNHYVSWGSLREAIKEFKNGE